ncbi:MAG: hypothetical protein V1920_06420, partial [Bacillota bacterium]
KKTYVKNWDHMKPKEKHKITITGPNAKEIDIKKISHIVEEVGYWRKANQIHNWFVQNVQEGEDDCKEYYVRRDQLEDLLNLVETVLKCPAKAEELLPCQSGFFFGQTIYDQYYFQDLEHTKKILTETLKKPGDEFSYQSSW